MAAPYTDADVDLVADAIVDARLQGHRDWTDAIARAVLDALVAAGRLAPTRHVVEIWPGGWTIKHPLACRPDLSNCPVSRVTGIDPSQLDGPPVPPGFYECSANDLGDRFLIGERVDTCTCPTHDVSTLADRPGTRTLPGLDPACPLHGAHDQAEG